METWCFMEAKTFVFSVVEGASVVRLEERRGFSGLVFLGAQCTAWLVSMVEELLWFPGDKEFVKSSREGSKVIIVRRSGNFVGRFLELAVYTVVGWSGLILIPEGCEGRGWGCFVVALGKVYAFLEASAGSGRVPPSPVMKKPGKIVGLRLFQGSALTRGTRSIGEDGAPSYVEVLRLAARLSAAEKTTMRLRDPLGKDLNDVEYLLGLSQSDAKTGSAARGKLAFHFGDEIAGGQVDSKGEEACSSLGMEGTTREVKI
jgi:hypothetical protein